MRQRKNSTPFLAPSKKQVLNDQQFSQDVDGQQLINIVFERPVAKNRTFTNCTFKYSFFVNGYFRNCNFKDCDFTGVRFVRCNMVGCTFDGCTFDYADFERTQIDSDILKSCCPSWENVKLKFARSLRTNYQALGDSQSANRAMNVELDAMAEHHKKAWKSNDTYYRRKYKGWIRCIKFLEWAEFRFLDLVWGNGEKLGRLLWLVVGFVTFLGLVDLAVTYEKFNVGEILLSFKHGWLIFMSYSTPNYMGAFWGSIIYALRLIIFALFLSILIKRLNRR